MSDLNGNPNGESALTPEDKDDFSEIEGDGGLDEWIFLVPTVSETAVLARCTERGFLVDYYAKPGIDKRLKGRKIILVMPGKETPEQKKTVERFRQSTALQVIVWRPSFYGDPGYETLGDLEERFNLRTMIALERPWDGFPEDQEPRPKPDKKPKKVDHLTVGLADVVIAKVDWFYENRLAPGFISLFAGRSGFGKSFVTCDIVARLSRGEPGPFSNIRHQPMRTLFISEDSPEIVLGPRLFELQADPAMVRFMTWDAMAEYTLGDTGYLDRAYREASNPQLIVIDPPANFLGSVDEHKNAEVRAVLKGLIAWLDLHRVAAILITHINKQLGKGMDAVERIMGSVAWGTTARITCAFTKDPDSPGQFLFGGTKNNLGEVAQTLMYKIVKTETLATVQWEGATDTTMDDAIDQVKKKSKGKSAVEWLQERFREKREWESTEIRAMGREHGITSYALFESPEVLALPIRKRKRMNANGEQYWVWQAEEGWPPRVSESSDSSESYNGSY